MVRIELTNDEADICARCWRTIARHRSQNSGLNDLKHEHCERDQKDTEQELAAAGGSVGDRVVGDHRMDSRVIMPPLGSDEHHAV
jgi:hypothetical protein